MDNISVLKLDSSFKPIEIVSWKEAFLLTLPCTRRNIMIRDESRCQYCCIDFREPDLTIDHVMPRSKGGKTTWTNVVMACKPCNQQKRDLLLENTSLSLSQPPRRPSYRSIIKKRIKTSNVEWKEYL